MSLPREIYKEIGQYLPPSSQSAYHQVGRAFREFPINPEECCKEPSNYEIAKWLWNQSLILSDPNTKPSSIFRPLYQDVNFTFGPLGLTSLKSIRMWLNNGYLISFSRKHLSSINDILEYLGPDQLYLSSPSNAFGTNDNWLMIRDIFSQRASCRRQNVSSDKCYLQVLAKWMNIESGYIYNTLKRFVTFLTKETTQKLETDFSHAFLSPLILPLDQKDPQYDLKYINFSQQYGSTVLDHTKVESWLKEWISQLKSQDLAKNVRIVAANTNYS